MARRSDANLKLVPPIDPSQDIAIAEADSPTRPAHFPAMISWPGLALVCWVMSALIGATGLSGYLAGPQSFTRLGTGFVPIAQSEATLFIVLGLSLVFYVYGQTRKFARPTVAATTIMTAVFSLLKLVEVMGNAWLGVEHIFNRHLGSFGKFLTGTMSPASALTFFFMSMALFLLILVADQRKRAILSALVLTGVCAFFTAVILLSYCAGSPLMYDGVSTPMSYTAAMAFFFLEAGTLIAIGPRHPPLRQLLNKLLPNNNNG